MVAVRFVISSIDISFGVFPVFSLEKRVQLTNEWYHIRLISPTNSRSRKPFAPAVSLISNRSTYEKH